MRKVLFGMALVALLLVAGFVVKDRYGPLLMAMATAPKDARIEVDVPGPMRTKMLSIMRGFQEALADILSALARGDGPAAATIAESRLGMDPPGATDEMRAMMASHMPDEMRALGMAMHEQATTFAEEAAKLKPGADMRPALAELSKVVQACSACHVAYRFD